MTPDLVVPIIASIGWLAVCGAALASYRLKWGQMVKLALVWLAIFTGFFLLVEWFMVARNTTSALM